MKNIIKSLFTFKSLVIILFIFIVLNNDHLNQRIDSLENQLNVKGLATCDEKNLKNVLQDKVVRIIGSYSEGTGFALSNSEIITNYHVIDGEESPKVVFPDGKIEAPISMKGSKREDVAILQVSRDLVPFDFADMNKNLFGDNVYSAGYPLGSSITGDLTIVKGSFSGLRKTSGLKVDYIESSIGTEHGMSGGPLVNSCGEVLGVTTASITGTSYFLAINDILENKETISNEIEKVDLDLTTPQGLVEAFYFYIRTRDLEKAYLLQGAERQAKANLEVFKRGYEDTLQVDLISSKQDEFNKEKVNIKIVADDWVGGKRVSKYFEGYWIVRNEKLEESNIKEISEPGWEWWSGD